MKLYLSTIGSAMVLIATLNSSLGTASPMYIIASVIFCTALQFLLDGAIAILIRLMPERWFGVDNPLFRVPDRSKKFHRQLHVKKWKDRVWELGWLGGFGKRRLEEPKNPKYIEKFIIECNKGVLTHWLSCPIGFLAMLMIEGTCVFTVALPIAALNLYLNILPTLVLRYNTPALKRLLLHLNEKV